MEPLTADLHVQLIPRLEHEGLGLGQGFVLVRLISETEPFGTPCGKNQVKINAARIKLNSMRQESS